MAAYNYGEFKIFKKPMHLHTYYTTTVTLLHWPCANAELWEAEIKQNKHIYSAGNSRFVHNLRPNLN